MNVYVNSDRLDISEADNLDTLLKKAGLSGNAGIAVAVNNTVIPRNNWEVTALKENDKIIVIKATQGG